MFKVDLGSLRGEKGKGMEFRIPKTPSVRQDQSFFNSSLRLPHRAQAGDAHVIV